MDFDYISYLILSPSACLSVAYYLPDRKNSSTGSDVLSNAKQASANVCGFSGIVSGGSVHVGARLDRWALLLDGRGMEVLAACHFCLGGFGGWEMRMRMECWLWYGIVWGYDIRYVEWICGGHPFSESNIVQVGVLAAFRSFVYDCYRHVV